MDERSGYLPGIWFSIEPDKLAGWMEVSGDEPCVEKESAAGYLNDIVRQESVGQIIRKINEFTRVVDQPRRPVQQQTEHFAGRLARLFR